MIEAIKSFFTTYIQPVSEDASHVSEDDVPASAEVHPDRMQIATCALFLETARVDEEFSQEEREHIIHICRTKFGVSLDIVNELLRLTDTELNESIDYRQFTNLINEHCTVEDKQKLLEQLWQIVYADGKLSSREEWIVRKLAALLKLDHQHFIASKLKVLGNR